MGLLVAGQPETVGNFADTRLGWRCLYMTLLSFLVPVDLPGPFDVIVIRIVLSPTQMVNSTLYFIMSLSF